MAGFPGLAKLLGISDDAAKALSKESAAVLKAVDTPEKAAKLSGANRNTYMKALDEAYGNRAKRSADMGFGDQTWYHGTASDIPEFKPEFRGTSTVADNAKQGFFFADNPSTADSYAEMASQRSVTEHTPEIERLQLELTDPAGTMAEKTKKIARLQALEKESAALTGNNVGNFDPYYPSANGRQNILPVRLKMGDSGVSDLAGKSYDADLYSDALAEAKAANKDSALLKNTRDNAGLNSNAPVKEDVAVVFKPEQVRSKFAAFDPRFSKSGSLVAGAAAMPADLKPDEGMSWQKLKAYLENPGVALENLKRAGQPTEGDMSESARKSLMIGTDQEPTSDEILAQMENDQRTIDNATGFIGGGLSAKAGNMSKLKETLRGKTTLNSLNKPGAAIPEEFGSRADIIRRANETASVPTQRMSQADAQAMWSNDWKRKISGKEGDVSIGERTLPMGEFTPAGSSAPSASGREDLSQVLKQLQLENAKLKSPDSVSEIGEFTQALRGTPSSSENYQQALRNIRGSIDDLADTDFPLPSAKSRIKKYEDGAVDELMSGKPSKEFRSQALVSRGGTQRPEVYQESANKSLATADRKMTQRLGSDARTARVMDMTDEEMRAAKDALLGANGMEVGRLYELGDAASSPERLAQMIRNNPLKELGTGTLPRLREALKGKK